MKFSVIVPVYNVEKYILECLMSLKKQIFTQFEVIIVDDGSTDNSNRLCTSITNIDSRFKLLTKKMVDLLLLEIMVYLMLVGNTFVL